MAGGDYQQEWLILHKIDYSLILGAKPHFCSLLSCVTVVTSDQKQSGLRLNSSTGTGGPQPSPSGTPKPTQAHNDEELWARLGLLWGEKTLSANRERKIHQILFTDWEISVRILFSWILYLTICLLLVFLFLQHQAQERPSLVKPHP